MINFTYKLISPKIFRCDLNCENLLSNKLIVRPKYLSICAADQRYYSGKRKPEVLKSKLPMALIHEAVGEVVFDSTNEYKVGTNVVMVPNIPCEKNKNIKENYLRTSKFKSSSCDGFMQSYVYTDKDRVIPIENNIDLRIAALCELLSVSINAINAFKEANNKKIDTIGVWGTGSVGFAVALVLKKYFSKAKVIVIGRSIQKEEYFSFADERYLIDELPEDFSVDQAFECVGGIESSTAINQIIDYINPQGTISLMGVSEEQILINTRMVLEKGIKIIGNSRSSKEDFKEALDFLSKYPDASNYLNTIISSEIVVKNINDIYKAFDEDIDNYFKTIMKWEI